jgi:CRP/FNR family transcriptional regulator, cyclic AMP receptor protein
MIRLLRTEQSFSNRFLAYMLRRNVRIEADLVDQLFNSNEKRLARALLLLTRFGKQPTPETVVARLSQETLAEMVGTMRGRISLFMNKFRKLGFIKYNGGLQINDSLMRVLLYA